MSSDAEGGQTEGSNAAASGAGASQERGARIQLAIHVPAGPPSNDLLNQLGGTTEMAVEPASTVLQLKQQIERQVHGNPSSQGQTLIWRGRRLRDDETLEDLVRECGPTVAPSDVHTLHLAVQPTAWKTASQPTAATTAGGPSAHAVADRRLAALSTGLRGASNTPTTSTLGISTADGTQLPLPGNAPAPGAPLIRDIPPISPMSAMPSNSFPELDSALPSQSAGSQVRAFQGQWRTFLGHFFLLSTSQRAEFVGTVSQAERYYAQHIWSLYEQMHYQVTPVNYLGPSTTRVWTPSHSEGADAQGSSSTSPNDIEIRTERLLEACNLMSSIRQAEQQARADYDSHAAYQKTLLGAAGAAGLNVQFVTIGGYPFLLHVPKRFGTPPDDRKELYVRYRRAHAVHECLSCMLNITRTNFGSHVIPNPGAFFSARAGPYSHAHAEALAQMQRQAGNAHPLAANPFARQPAPAMAANAHVHGHHHHHHHPLQNPVGPAPGLLDPAVAGRGPDWPAPGAFGAVGVGAQRAAAIAGPNFPTARLAIVINMDEILAVLVPLLFLSVKLGFLIYIFGRHASTSKRAIMIAMAILWVIWEGISIRRRRQTLEARRQQQQLQAGQNQQRAGLPQNAQEQAARIVAEAQERRRAFAGGEQGAIQAPQPLFQRGDEGNNRDQQVVLRQRAEEQHRRRGQRMNGNGVAPAGGTATTSSSRHRLAPSRLSPKYWMQLVARVGLTAENREMGLSRSQPMPGADPTAPQVLTTERVLRNVWIGLVLFIGTLVPEVERLRRKALDKRQRKITELQNMRIAAAVAQQQQRDLSGSPSTAHGAPQAEVSGSSLVQASSSSGGSDSRLPPPTSRPDGPADTRASIAPPNAASLRPHHDVSGVSTPLTPGEGQVGEARTTGDPRLPDEIGVDRDLFDPPFDEATLEAAFATTANPPQGTRQNGDAAANDRARSDGDRATGAGGASSEEQIASGEGSPEELDRVGQTSLHLEIPQQSQLAGQGEEDLSATLSPAEQDTDDENEVERGVDGVDDEVGMILF